MTILAQITQPSNCYSTQPVVRNAYKILIGLCSIFLLPAIGLAQSVSLPQVTNGSGSPACASSANGTGHLVCVIADGNDNLSAFSVLAQNQAFPATPLDPPTRNPRPLGVVGFVGISSCASTADATGDVVCAYTSTAADSTKGKLMGVRFNVFNGTIYPVMNLGFASGGHASCANGSQRFTVKGPAPQEGREGATICGVRGTTNFMVGVAFNPATGYLQTQSFISNGFLATTDPSCNNANDNTNQVICVYNRARGVRSFAFDPRRSPQFVTAEQVPNFGEVSSLVTPSCSSPNDGSGQVLCGIRNGFAFQAFALDPRSGFQSAFLTITSSQDPHPFTGNPSCSGIGDGSKEIICTIRESFPTSSNSNAAELFGLKFDPRVNANFGSIAANILGTSDLSCTFQNIFPAQISCAGIGVSQGEIFAVLYTR